MTRRASITLAASVAAVVVALAGGPQILESANANFIMNPYRHANGGGVKDVLTGELIALWMLDEASGDAIDSVGGLDAAEDATIGAVADVPPGFSGTSRDIPLFRKFEVAVDGTAMDFHGTSGWTTAGWIKVDALNSTYCSAWGRYGVSGDETWEVGIDGSAGGASFRPYLRAYTVGDLLVRAYENNASCTTGVWHHIAAVYDGDAPTIYVDGNAVSSTSIGDWTAGIRDTDAPFRIGENGEFDEYDGKMREVAVFGRALTEAEVAALYSDGTNYAR